MFSDNIYHSTIPREVNIDESWNVIPKALLKASCWMGVDFALKDNGRLDKIPEDLTTLPGQDLTETWKYKAKKNDPTTWVNFATSLDAVMTGRCHGMMICLPQDVCMIDFDDVPDIRNNNDVDALVRACGAYAEYTPSGAGLHILGYFRDPIDTTIWEEFGDGKIEIYKERLCTITGDVHPDSNPILPELTDYIKRQFSDAFNRQPEQSELGIEARTGVSALTDEEVIDKATKHNGDKFTALWSGSTQGYKSQSEADLALVSLLVFWTDGDVPQIKSLFAQSGLYRNKFARSYGTATINKALKNVVERYNPEYYANERNDDDDDPTTAYLDVYRKRHVAVEVPSKAPDPPSTSKNVLTTAATNLLQLLRSRPPESFEHRPINYLIDSIIAEGTLNLITGLPGGGKSTLVSSWCNEMAEKGHDILYLDRDNPLPIIQERTERLFGGVTHPKFSHWGLWMTDEEGNPKEPLPPQSPTLIEIVRQMVKPVVVFDTLASFLDGDENDNHIVGAVFKHFRHLTILGATTLVIHHPGKAEGAKSRGGQAIEGACDRCLIVKGSIDPITGNLIKMDVVTFKTRLQGETVTYQMQNGIPVRSTATLRDRLLNLLRANPGVSKNKFEKIAMNQNYSRPSVRNFMDDVIMAGLVTYENNKFTVKSKDPVKPVILFGDEDE